MNQGFKLRFDQLRENDPTSQDTEPVVSEEFYASPGHSRNLCLIWPDGRRAFFNYAYLVACEFDPNSEKNVIKLNFSSYQVTLSGYSLQLLFMALLDHLPRIVTVIDPRYVLEEDKPQSIVIEIITEKKDA